MLGALTAFVAIYKVNCGRMCVWAHLWVSCVTQPNDSTATGWPVASEHPHHCQTLMSMLRLSQQNNTTNWALLHTLSRSFIHTVTQSQCWKTTIFTHHHQHTCHRARAKDTNIKPTRTHKSDNHMITCTSYLSKVTPATHLEKSELSV